MSTNPADKKLRYAAHPNDIDLDQNMTDIINKASNDHQIDKDVLFTRADLEVLASGKISSIFGEEFAEQDQYHRQVRMPEPPLLLADRILRIDGEPKSMKPGTLWSETDVTADDWFVRDGCMPPGIMIESGQADLLLISWMGIDFLNKGERIYRLLGCDLTFYGGLARVGETLHYEIHLDGIAKHGDIRLMFFHYDCTVNGELRMRVRNGQAGFFSDQELAESKGILWLPEEAQYQADARLDKPKVVTQRKSFNKEQITAFTKGRPYDCFGEGFEFTQTHNHSPRIPDGQMCLIDEITHFEPEGGPHGRGYLRAVQNVTPDDWFFKGHFKNDPCMPGTLMGETGFQLLAFYLAGLGFTIDKDGWRFEPGHGVESAMRCRGQCTPTSKQVVYEIFVDELIAEPYPTLYVDLLATVDGLKGFHAHRFCIRLNPGWPLERKPELYSGVEEPTVIARSEKDGITYDYKAMIACAWGKPSMAFGELYRQFDEGKPVPRLPGPPYHLMSRIISVDQESGSMKSGTRAVAEYDVPADAWYFNENSNHSMPFSVLMEIGLQPCGWLASYLGSVLELDGIVFFRNLDGNGTIHRDVFNDAKCLRTETTITSISKLGQMILNNFEVQVFQDQDLVFEMKTGFGFFPGESFADQAGLSIEQADRDLLEGSSEYSLDLRDNKGEFFDGEIHMARQSLLMIDRIAAFWPEGGINGLGALRAEKDVHMNDWFFKAHFYQDPVQPGSLGVEALIQCLQFYMLKSDLHLNINKPRFRSVVLDKETLWKYRGQVVPHNKLISTTIDVLEVIKEDNYACVMARASLWVDGKRIYELNPIGLEIVGQD